MPCRMGLLRLSFGVLIALAQSGLTACDPGGARGGGVAIPLDAQGALPLDAHTFSHVDAAATPAAGCIKGANVDAIQLEILATAGVCGVLCVTDRAPSDCAAACVEARNAHIGPTCSRCFGDLALCAATHCLGVCAAPSNACVACGESNCADTFAACYGDASSPLDPSGGDTFGGTPTSDPRPDTGEPSPDTLDTPEAGPDGPCAGAPRYYLDGDGDGFGAPEFPADDDLLGAGCTAPPGYTDQVGDCDDTDATRYPGGHEACNLVDDDCDGRTDDGCWADVSAGGYHTCAVRKDDGGVVCWGSDFSGEATEPAGSYAVVAAGGGYNCAARTTGGITCWGSSTVGDWLPETGTYVQMTASQESFACALRDDHVAACWGHGDPVYDLPLGHYLSLSAGTWSACGVTTAGEVLCWGFGGNGELDTPGGTFTKVASGYAGSCAIRSDGAVRCWGHAAGNPAGTFLDVALGDEVACAVRSDGTIYCWGAAAPLGDAPTDAGWARVAVGLKHACALGEDGAIACWGNNDYGQLGPISEP